MKVLPTREMVKKVLKKGKNDIFYARLGHIDETHSKKIISIVDNIDGDPTKICFYASYISAKIMQNPSSKPMSEVITKIDKMHMDLRGPSSDISLKRNCYM